MPVLLALLLLPLLGEESRAPLVPPEVARTIIAEGLDNSRVMESLDALVNGIGPRLTGSANLERATLWALDAFTALGLDARREHWGDVAVGFDRGPSRGAMVSPERVELEFLTRAWSAGTDGPVRGRAVLAPTDLEELAARRASLAGAWVLLAPTPDDATIDSGFIEAREQALQGVGVAGRIRRSSLGDRLRMSGNRNITMDDLPREVTAWLTADAFDDIVARIGRAEDVQLEFDIDNRFVPGPVPQYNVIADLRGSDFPDEYVVIGGHLDSWDGAPGANDNGTGVTTTLEAARLVVAAGVRPRRTLRFVLWTGEEQGLLGSRAHVAANPDDMPRTSAVFVHDGGTNPLTGLGVTAAMRPQFEHALQALFAFVAEQDGPPFALRTLPGLRGGSSDHDSYLAAGVPGFFWDQEGDADYNVTWHTQKDTYETAVPAYQRHSSVVAALTALGVANLPELLSRRGMTSVPRRLGVILADDGVTVERVISSGQAAAAGIVAGDRFVRVNETDVGPNELTDARDTGEGRKVMTWMRGDEMLHAVFEWDDGHIERDPESVSVDTASGAHPGEYTMGRVDGPAAGAAVILLTDDGASFLAWEPVRRALYDAGIATLRLDARALLGSRIADGAAHDLVPAAAAVFLAGRRYDPSRIGFLPTAGRAAEARAGADALRAAGGAAPPILVLASDPLSADLESDSSPEGAVLEWRAVDDPAAVAAWWTSRFPAPAPEAGPDGAAEPPAPSGG